MSLGPYWVGDKPRDSVDIFVTREGSPVDLSGYTSATIELEGPAGVVDVSAVGVLKAADRVTITWPNTVSLFTQPGLYTLQVILNTATTTEHAASLSFLVQSTTDAPANAWATPSDVVNYTGVGVDGPKLAQAQFVVELYAGVGYESTWDTTTATSKLSARNSRILKAAVCYQAAFMATHEELFSRAAVRSFNQDGMSASADSEDGWVLAPLASRALKQLSWRGDTKTVRVSRGRRSSDPYGCVPWRPMNSFGRTL